MKTYTVTYSINVSIASERITYASGLAWSDAVTICLANSQPHMRILEDGDIRTKAVLF